MPVINREPIKEKRVDYQHTDNSSKFYNSLAWRKLRKFYYEHHPICEECLKRNIINDTKEIHHKHFILSGQTEEEQWKLLLDINNLIALCDECHDKMHIKAKRYGLQYVDELTDKEYYEHLKYSF